MRLNRAPQPGLRPFIKSVWLVDGTSDEKSKIVEREYVLPTGEMHLAFRLSEHPVRLFPDRLDSSGQTFGVAVVGGARASSYMKDVSEPTCSVGVQFQPGAACLLFGVPANELAGKHFRLEDLWGRGAVDSARQQLQEEHKPTRRLELLESLLATRLPGVRGMHPAVAMALQRFAAQADVHDVVRDSGYSHRRFIALFHEAVGLTPKLYSRVQRFQRALARVARDRASTWVDLALAAGYSDQSHFNREFLEFAGVTPGEYRKILPLNPHHVTVKDRI